MTKTKTDLHPVSIAPMLSVRRGAAAVDFYKTAFGAEELFRIDDDSGAVVARLSVGGAEFWLADESPANSNHSPESLGGSTTRQNGWLIGRVVDPFGHHWEIGKPVT
jgi:PhnB protein